MSKTKKSDLIGKIIVIALIGVFVAVGIFTMVGKRPGAMGPMGGMGGMPPMAGGGMPRGGASAAQPVAVTVSAKTMEKETIQKTRVALARPMDDDDYADLGDYVSVYDERAIEAEPEPDGNSAIEKAPLKKKK